MNAIMKPRSGSTIGRAVTALEDALGGMSREALATVVEQFDGELDSLLRYGVRMGLLERLERGGVPWYQIGSGKPVEPPAVAPPPAPVAAAPSPVIVPAPALPAPRPKPAPAVAPDGIDIDAVHKRVATPQPASLARLLAIEIEAARGAVHIAQGRLDALLELSRGIAA